MIAGDAQSAIVLEVNCETDFVGKDESFVKFCQQVADKALSEKCNDIDKLNATILDANQTVEDVRKALIVRLGENIQVRRIANVNANANEKIGSYVHNGRIGTLVLISGGNDALAKDIAMHVAAMRPQFMKLEDVPQEIVAKEKEIMTERAKQSGKPDNILEKIVQGMLQKHFAEVCLSGQPFFKDPDQTVGALLKSNNANLLQMIRLEVGEGIEVTKKSFEEEVALARGSN